MGGMRRKKEFLDLLGKGLLGKDIRQVVDKVGALEISDASDFLHAG